MHRIPTRPPRVLLVLALALPASASAATYKVDASTGSYRTVQAGLDAADRDGDVVEVMPGTYNECVVPLAKHITLRKVASATGTVTINCTTSAGPFKSTAAKDFTFIDLTLQGTGGTLVGTPSADVTFTRVTLQSTTSGVGGIDADDVDATDLTVTVTGAPAIDAAATVSIATSTLRATGSTGVIGTQVTVVDGSITAETGVQATDWSDLDGTALITTGACVKAVTNVQTTLVDATCASSGAVGLDLGDDLDATRVEISGPTTGISLSAAVATLDDVTILDTDVAIALSLSDLTATNSAIEALATGLSLASSSVVGLSLSSVEAPTAISASTGGSSSVTVEDGALTGAVTLASGSLEMTDTTVGSTGDGIIFTGTGDTTLLGVDVRSSGTALEVTASAGQRVDLDLSLFDSDAAYGIDATVGTVTADTVLMNGALGNRVSAGTLDFDYVSAIGGSATGLEVLGTLANANFASCLFSGTTPFSEVASGATAVVTTSAASSGTGTDIRTFSGTNEVGALALDPGGRLTSTTSVAVDIASSDGSRVDLDGIPRNKGGGADAGAYEFVDTDLDGLSDGAEIAWGMDATKKDTDGDGVSDLLEWGVGSVPLDTDGDGRVDGADVDDDNDGVPTSGEDLNANNNRFDDDTDGDTVPNFRDADDDDDDIPSRDEDRDSNGDPRDDDTDADSIPDYLDDDDDNDGLLTQQELEFDGADPHDADSDDDGVRDGAEWGTDAAPRDFDGDGVPDISDDDDDDDGLPTIEEGSSNLDHDELPNYLDLDADGDGKPDEDEGNGDADADGVPNFLDENDEDGGTGDSDDDGITNKDEVALGLDPVSPDSDGDGLLDLDELGSVASPNDTDEDGINDAADPDDDGDGAPTIEELGDLPEDPQDTDGDEIPDYLDTDDDDDGELSEYEDADGNGDPTDDDTDCDGLPDYLEVHELENDGDCGDRDFDGLANLDEATVATDPDDYDSDDDGIPDGPEVGADVTAAIDTDGDGILDALDDDDDDDGIPTDDEGSYDTDGDGAPNHRDTDSDDDGVPDAEEGTADVDCDGAPDFLDADGEDGPCMQQFDTDPNRDLEIDETGCSTAPGGAWSALFAMAALLGLRRQPRNASTTSGRSIA